MCRYSSGYIKGCATIDVASHALARHVDSRDFVAAARVGQSISIEQLAAVHRGRSAGHKAVHGIAQAGDGAGYVGRLADPPNRVLRRRPGSVSRMRTKGDGAMLWI